jgi:glycerate 2-kinase
VRRHLTVSREAVGIAVGRSRVTAPRGALWVGGAGKAAAAMARAVARRLPEVRGVVIAPRPTGSGPTDRRRRERTGRIRVRLGEHPVPGRGSFSATRALVDELARQPADCRVLFLLSGGASALLALPARGISRRDKARLNRLMLRAGMPIDQMNAVRKHVSAVKGGGLLRLSAPRTICTLALSDVPGDDLATIGSGPTVADPTRARDACAALLGRVDRTEVPPAVLRRLESATPETVKPGDPCLARSRSTVVGSNRTAVAAAARRARSLGYAVRVGSPALAGSARRCGERIAARLPRRPRRATAFLLGGEPVVDASGASGRGGRAQELALAAAPYLAGTGWTLLAAGTDGVDGATPAAGAVVDGRTLARSGADAILRALADHDSYGYFDRWGGLFVTGPTGTNVMDLVIALHPGPRAREEDAVVRRRSERSPLGRARATGRPG